MTYVEWLEPYVDSDPVIMRVTVSTAIKQAKRVAQLRGYTYPNDKAALDDFVAVNWASLKDYDN